MLSWGNGVHGSSQRLPEGIFEHQLLFHQNMPMCARVYTQGQVHVALQVFCRQDNLVAQSMGAESEPLSLSPSLSTYWLEALDKSRSIHSLGLSFPM